MEPSNSNKNFDLIALLPPRDSSGIIRAERPSIYIFPVGDEDAAFFVINGFAVLLDGGDGKEMCYWNLLNRYSRVSAIISSRVSAQCLMGVSMIMRRKAIEACHPDVGAFISNLPMRNYVSSDSHDAEVIRTLHEDLDVAGLKPIVAFSNAKFEPITLYEVIGEGNLSMIILNPERSAKEFPLLYSALKAGENIEELCSSLSLALIILWTPADESKPTIRILYPGSCPLSKLYSALEKVVDLACLKRPEFHVGTAQEKAVARTNRPSRARQNLSSQGISIGQMPLSKRVPVSSVSGNISNTKSPPSTRTSKVASQTSVAKRAAVSANAPKPATTRLSMAPQRTVLKNIGSKPLVMSNIDKKGNGRSSIAPAFPANKGGLRSKEFIKTDKTHPHHVKKSVNGVHGEQKPAAVCHNLNQRNNLEDIRSEKPAQVHVSKPVETGENSAITETTFKSQDTCSEICMESKGNESTSGGSIRVQETPLLESTPLGQPLIFAMKNFVQTNAEGEKEASDSAHENSYINPDLFGFKADEFTSGLVSSIVDGVIGKSQSGLSFSDFNGGNLSSHGTLVVGAGSCPSDTNIYHDHRTHVLNDTSQQISIDAVLDNVIESLVGESEDEVIGKDVMTDFTDVEQTNERLLKAQKDYEDQNATEQNLPPIASQKIRSRPSTLSAAPVKPKLSHPVYYDIVFIPHCGSQPLLMDELSAAAFASVIRSKEYIVSGQNAIRTHILDGIISAKSAWNKPGMEIYVLPTHFNEEFRTHAISKDAKMREFGIRLRCPSDRTVLTSDDEISPSLCTASKLDL